MSVDIKEIESTPEERALTDPDDCDWSGRPPPVWVSDVVSQLVGELKESRKAQKRAEFIISRILQTSLDYGWHGNPSNHTMKLTLYFGDCDPRDEVESDKHGPKMTRKFLEFFAGDEK